MQPTGKHQHEGYEGDDWFPPCPICLRAERELPKLSVEQVKSAVRELLARRFLYEDGIGYTEAQQNPETLKAAAQLLEDLASECRGALWDMEHTPTAWGPR